MIPPPHASSLGPASLGAPSPHTPCTPPPPRDQHSSAAPCGRGQRHSGGPHTPPGMRPPPLPKDQTERGRREWAAGKAGEAGHHAPRGLSHSNSPWGDAAGGQRTGDAAAKGVCGGGLRRCPAQLWKRPWASEEGTGESDGERHGRDGRGKKRQTRGNRRTDMHRGRGSQRRTAGPREGPAEMSGQGAAVPHPPPHPLRPPGGAREPRSAPQPALLGPSCCRSPSP